MSVFTVSFVGVPQPDGVVQEAHAEYPLERRLQHQLLPLHAVEVAVVSIPPERYRVVPIEMRRPRRERNPHRVDVVVRIQPVRHRQLFGDIQVDPAKRIDQLLDPLEVEDHPVVDLDAEVLLQVVREVPGARLEAAAFAHTHAIRRVDPVRIHAVFAVDVDEHVAREAQDRRFLRKRVHRRDHDHVREVRVELLVAGTLVDADDEQVDAFVERGFRARGLDDGARDVIEDREHARERLTGEEGRPNPVERHRRGIHRGEPEGHQRQHEQPSLTGGELLACRGPRRRGCSRAGARSRVHVFCCHG